MTAGVPETWNVIPAEVRLRAAARAFRPHVRDQLEAAIGRVPAGAAFWASPVETELPRR